MTHAFHERNFMTLQINDKVKFNWGNSSGECTHVHLLSPAQRNAIKFSAHALIRCSKQHVDDFMSQYWGQIQWFTFRPFQSWYLQVVLTTKHPAATTQTHLYPVLCLTVTQKNTHTHRHIHLCTHTSVMIQKNQIHKAAEITATMTEHCHRKTKGFFDSNHP